MRDDRQMDDALLLIDLQRDYFADGELARCRDELVATCNALVASAHEAGIPVIEVRTIHDPAGSTWTLSMREDGQGVVLEGSSGAEPVEGLDTGKATVVVKTRDSAFFGTDLLSVLRAEGLVTCLCGVSTESCIAATASDAFAHDLLVTLVEDATASVDLVLHDRTLEQQTRQYRQPSLTSADLRRSWSNRIRD